MKRWRILSAILVFGIGINSMKLSYGMNVILDHDGGVDDFSVLTILLNSKEKGIDLKAITIVPADSYKEPTVNATFKYLGYFGASSVQVAASDMEGTHLFPDEWRVDSLSLEKIPVLESIPSSGTAVSRLETTAPELLVELLSQGEKYQLILTGPLSNLAKALELKPSIRENIERAYIMGGAVRVPGNVEQEGHDGSAEWNFYNNPIAAYEVIQSGIPITLVGLDATNSVPVTLGFLDKLKLQQDHSRIAPLGFQTWDVARRTIEMGIYQFWDTLTAAALLNPSILKTERLKVKVLTEAPSEGRVVVSEEGQYVDVAIGVNEENFDDLILSYLR